MNVIPLCSTIAYESGIGLSGLFLAKIASQTILSDRSEEILALLKRNITLNENEIRSCNAFKLDWQSESDSNELLQRFKRIDVVAGSEIVYAKEAIPMIFDVVRRVAHRDTKFVLMFNERT